MPHSTSATSPKKITQDFSRGTTWAAQPPPASDSYPPAEFFFKMPEAGAGQNAGKNQQKHAGQAKRQEKKKPGNLRSHGTASFQNATQNNMPPTRNPLGTGKQAALLICGGSPSRSYFVIERFGCLWFQIMAPIGVPRNPNWALIVLGSVAWGHGQMSCHIWQP